MDLQKIAFIICNIIGAWCLIQTVECDFLVGQKIKDIVIEPTFFQGTSIDLAQSLHYVRTRTMRMNAMSLVFRNFMIWTSPWTTNSTIFAIRYPVQVIKY